MAQPPQRRDLAWIVGRADLRMQRPPRGAPPAPHRPRGARLSNGSFSDRRSGTWAKSGSAGRPRLAEPADRCRPAITAAPRPRLRERPPSPPRSRPPAPPIRINSRKHPTPDDDLTELNGSVCGKQSVGIHDKAPRWRAPTGPPSRAERLCGLGARIAQLSARIRVSAYPPARPQGAAAGGGLAGDLEAEGGRGGDNGARPPMRARGRGRRDRDMVHGLRIKYDVALYRAMSDLSLQDESNCTPPKIRSW